MVRSLPIFAPLLGAPREPESDISDHHKNIAFAVQDACEAAMMSVLRWRW